MARDVIGWSNHITRACLSIFPILAIVMWVPSAHGGVIPADSVPGAATNQTNLSNNDETSKSLGQNHFRFNFSFDSLSAQHITIPVANSDGVTEYDFRFRLDNATEVAWHSLRLEIGFLTSQGFQASTLPGLDFDMPTPELGFEFGPLSAEPIHHTTTILEWGELEPDAQLPAWETDFALFFVDVPDLIQDPQIVPLDVWRYDGSNPIGYEFTIRITPNPIPEPASWLGLVLLSGIGLGLRTRRRA